MCCSRAGVWKTQWKCWKICTAAACYSTEMYASPFAPSFAQIRLNCSTWTCNLNKFNCSTFLHKSEIEICASNLCRSHCGMAKLCNIVLQNIMEVKTMFSSMKVLHLRIVESLCCDNCYRPKRWTACFNRPPGKTTVAGLKKKKTHFGWQMKIAKTSSTGCALSRAFDWAIERPDWRTTGWETRLEATLQFLSIKQNMARVLDGGLSWHPEILVSEGSLSLAVCLLSEVTWAI